MQRNLHACHSAGTAQSSDHVVVEGRHAALHVHLHLHARHAGILTSMLSNLLQWSVANCLRAANSSGQTGCHRKACKISCGYLRASLARHTGAASHLDLAVGDLQLGWCVVKARNDAGDRGMRGFSAASSATSISTSSVWRYANAAGFQTSLATLGASNLSESHGQSS